MTDKTLVIDRFTKALPTYDEDALLQRYSAERLIGLVRRFLGQDNPRRVFEIGCGTGILTRRIVSEFSPEMFVTNDICPSCADYISDFIAGGTAFIPGDAEEIDFPGPFDLIVSSSAIQWMSDTGKFLGKCVAVLPEGGMLAFSTFGPDNMKEISALTGCGLNYLSEDSWHTVIPSSLEILYCSSESIIQEYDSPYEVLRHLKRTGVTGISRQLWTRSSLSVFSELYRQKYSYGGGVSLTYHPLWLIARKQSKIRKNAV